MSLPYPTSVVSTPKERIDAWLDPTINGPAELHTLLSSTSIELDTTLYRQRWTQSATTVRTWSHRSIVPGTSRRSRRRR